METTDIELSDLCGELEVKSKSRKEVKKDSRPFSSKLNEILFRYGFYSDVLFLGLTHNPMNILLSSAFFYGDCKFTPEEKRKYKLERDAVIGGIAFAIGSAVRAYLNHPR